MKHKQQPTFTVRMERLPNRRSIERMRDAYQRMYQAADNLEKEEVIQEAQHEREFHPSSGSGLRQSLDLATGTGSDD